MSEITAVQYREVKCEHDMGAQRGPGVVANLATVLTSRMTGTPPTEARQLTIAAPAGIGEVIAGDDVAQLIADAVATDPTLKGLRDGDIIVATSKIISKAEAMSRPASERRALRRAQTVRTVARKLNTTIVATHHGLVQAGAGIDASNVDAGSILLLPSDPDASARRLRARIAELTGAEVGVIISDTSGRAWRVGQTDHAIGAAGVLSLVDYHGQRDAYGNSLRVTLTAVIDELAAAADLVKGKLSARPVAVIRGAAELLDADAAGARSVNRELDTDLFRLGSRESVLMAVLEVAGQADRYEDLVGLDDPAQVVAELSLPTSQSAYAKAILSAAYEWSA